MILGESSTKPVAVAPTNSETVSIHPSAINQPEGSIDLFCEVAEGQTLFYMSQKGANATESAEIGLVDAFAKAKEVGGIADPAAGLIV